MPHVTFIHGIANKPAEDDLRRIWMRALEEAVEPLSLSNEGITTSMVYWADLLYGEPIADASTNVPGPGLFFQGDGLFAHPIPFGDGMLCAGIGILRLGVVFPIGGMAAYPGGLTPNPISVGGAPINPGDIKHYQCWYRDAISFCTASTFNLTQGVSLRWAP